MTYEALCKKLGFDPIVDGYDYKFSGHEDDTQISPFDVLTYEELDFLYDFLVEHRSEMKTEPKNRSSRFA